MDRKSREDRRLKRRSRMESREVERETLREKIEREKEKEKGEGERRNTRFSKFFQSLSAKDTDVLSPRIQSLDLADIGCGHICVLAHTLTHGIHTYALTHTHTL